MYYPPDAPTLTELADGAAAVSPEAALTVRFTLPPGYPDVIAAGADALRWAAGIHRRLAVIAADPAAAQRELGLGGAVRMAWWPSDPERWERGADDLDDLARRLTARTEGEWVGGGAAAVFTAVDLDLLARAAAGASALPPRDPDSADDPKPRAAALRAVRGWLSKYLDVKG